MKRQTPWLVVTLVVAVPAYFLLPYLGGAIDAPVPTSWQGAFADALQLLRSLAFGFGICFLLLGFRSVRAFEPTARRWAVVLHLSISWLLLAWWAPIVVPAAHTLTLGGLLLRASVIVAAGVVAQRFLVFSRTLPRPARSR